MGYECLALLSVIFYLWCGSQLFSWGNPSTRRNPPTWHMSLPDFVT